MSEARIDQRETFDAWLPTEPYIVSIERIGRARYGDLWVGKLAYDIGLPHQTVRRWLAGTGCPTAYDLKTVKLSAMHHIARVIRAVEETP
ncbi:hypothetical protein SAMN02799631_00324 [Methylobacterium sp. 174MFSha1.1]|uniref:hypothetical protein n=1 Tax=Methylobacterium sp. 174MFSha1.1 TaxID=1502749 RepID=UPI0008F1E3BC|nr:hypothetical protein [Methylobacterium sp. 174MFSha1.1]SFU35665.1 hypothetical protein SAMN02799631_00324 [Methylobacterium sp. 174MFSha1.1]